jgi:choline-sulfatase
VNDKRHSWLRRVANGTLGGVLAGCVVAARESLALDVGLSHFPAVFGLTVWVLGCVGFFTGAFVAVIADGPPRSLAAGLRSRPREFAPSLMLGALLLPLALVVVSQQTLLVFSTQHASGTLGAAAAFLGVLTLLALFLVIRPLVRALASRLPANFDASRGLAIAVPLFVGALALLLWVGQPSGGTRAIERLGVLTREELDLRVPSYVVLAAALAAGATRWFSRLPPWISGSLALLPQLALFVPYGASFDSTAAIEVEQRTALARSGLAVLQGVTDRDGDGFSSGFGEGDCDDARADVYPGAVDSANNGVDEDCSGADEAEHGVPLPALSGPAALATSSAAHAVTASSAAVAPALSGIENVVLITVDTLRWDLGFMGNPRKVSPELDKLAQSSVVFEHAHALASYTGKSIGPMMIGRYPSETHRGWMHFNKYPPEDKMVQERLQAAGVRTISVQGHWYFDKDTGLGRGFDVLDLSASPKVPQAEGDKTVNSPAITDAAIAAISAPQTQGRRFFLWVHYLDPHAEYVAHPEFSFGTDSRALYEGEIAFTDFHIGRLLKALEDQGLSQKTAVIFTSDHGEAFGEHGMIRHGFEIWQEIVRVPLFVYVPGAKPGRVAASRSLIDLTPTVLDLFGVSAEPGFLRGTSWLADVHAPEVATPRPVFIDMPAGPYNGERQAYIDGMIKITTSNTRTMGVFDLANDPEEKVNLMKDAKVSQPAHERYLAFRRTLQPVKVVPR